MWVGAHPALRNSHEESAMSEPRIIKKYPNRRLYDTVESRYITLADIRRLVVERIDFVVVDKKSQDDITRAILLQVIAEQEQRGEPLMSRDFLSQIIRSYGGAAQGLVGSYLEQSLKLIANHHRELKEQLKTSPIAQPLESAASLAERNYQRWRSVQNDIFRLLAGASAGAARDESVAAETRPDPAATRGAP
jgi:polyhydroxyalkanoate synthesis repressor PhaR